MINQFEIDQIILNAFQEDIKYEDITTVATVDENEYGEAVFLAKADGIIAGLNLAERIFFLMDPKLNFDSKFNDGDKINSGDEIGVVKGNARSILTAERTVLNFMQRMSGIATMADKFSDLIKHTKAKIIDTRKTVPGLRILDKLAVTYGGCENHRIGLYDMFLIKDNHIIAAGSITKAVESCKNYNKINNTNFKIEVEVTNLEQLREALNVNPDVIMLDNFEIKNLIQAVQITNGKCLLEASGGVNFNTVKEIAETGVDLISVGTLTHSVKALDISLNFSFVKSIN